MTSGPYRYPVVRAGSRHSAKRRGNDRPGSDLGNQETRLACSIIGQGEVIDRLIIGLLADGNLTHVRWIR